MEPRHNRTAEADRVLGREGTNKRGQMTTALETLPGQRAWHAWKRRGVGTREAHGGLTRVSSGSKGSQSKRHASMGDGSPRSTNEAGQRPRREGGEQGKLFREGPQAAPQAYLPPSPKLPPQDTRA